MISHVTAHEHDGRSSATKPELKRTIVVKSEVQGINGKQMQAWVAEGAPAQAAESTLTSTMSSSTCSTAFSFCIWTVSSPAVLRAGETGHVPAKTVHQGRNGSNTFPMRVLVFGLTSEGEPIAISAE